MTGPHLVLVDDAAADLHAAERTVGRLFPDVVVECHPSGEALLARVDEADPATWWPRVFVLDVNMPGMNGTEVAATLRRSDWRLVPIVMLSGSANREEVRRCYDLGVAGYITKPMGATELESTWRAIGTYWFEATSPAEPPRGSP